MPRSARPSKLGYRFLTEAHGPSSHSRHEGVATGKQPNSSVGAWIGARLRDRAQTNPARRRAAGGRLALVLAVVLPHAPVTDAARPDRSSAGARVRQPHQQLFVLAGRTAVERVVVRGRASGSRIARLFTVAALVTVWAAGSTVGRRTRRVTHASALLGDSWPRRGPPAPA
jgi:hypothetical protein